jgi:hypothetical protein
LPGREEDDLQPQRSVKTDAQKPAQPSTVRDQRESIARTPEAEKWPGGTRFSPGSRWDELIAAGILHPPVEAGDPFEDWPDIRLSRGTAAELIDSDRGEA